MAHETKAIQGFNLSKSYKRLNAIDNLTFEIEENKITGLIGRNGAGKTALLRMRAGHTRPTHGQINVHGFNPFNNLTVASSTIFVDDTMAFPDALTLADILVDIAPFYPNWNRSLAEGLFDYFSLNPKIRHSHLSKGGKSLFNAIIGIAARAPITLLDEPTTGMDSAVRKDFYRALLKDYIDFPRTIILSSHLLNELEGLLEDILLLNQGKKVLHISLSELKEYAIGLRGQRQAVLDFVSEQEIIHQEEFGRDSVYVVAQKGPQGLVGGSTENKGLHKQKMHEPVRYEQAKQRGLEVVSVSADDLCVYLTSKHKGGIDDVFKRD